MSRKQPIASKYARRKTDAQKALQSVLLRFSEDEKLEMLKEKGFDDTALEAVYSIDGERGLYKLLVSLRRSR